MNTKLVFWTAFNSYQSSRLLRNLPNGAAHPVQTPAWTKRRSELFVKYNLPSILAQTYADFLYIILLDPALRHLTDAYLPPPADPRVLYVYDDEPTLSMLKEYDEIVLALIDNDDMYTRDAGQVMMECGTEWMFFKRGYALDALRRRLFHYDTIGSGPFFAHRFNPKTLARFDRDKRHPTHKDVYHLHPTILAQDKFCVSIHDRNTSSNLRMRYILNLVPNGAKVLRDQFGFIGK